MDHDANPQPINPNAMAVADAARLLTKAWGQPVTEAMIQADMAAGAPAADGTINLVHYAAWLVKESAVRD